MAKTPAQKVTTKKHLARIERERRQRTILLIAMAAVLLIVFGVIGYGVLYEQVLKANRIVAQVGEEKINVREFQTEVRFSRYLLVRQHEQYTSNALFAQFYTEQITQIETDLADPTTVGKRVLDQMVEDRIIAAEAAARGITVSDEELEAAMQEAFGFFADGTPTPAPTSTPFVTATLDPTQEGWLPPTPTVTPTPTEAPATATPTPTVEPPTATPTVEGPTATPGPTETPFPSATPYTLEGFQTEIGTFLDTVAPYGYDEAHLRAYIRGTLLREKLYEALTADLATEGEKIWARHILVATPEEAQQVLDRLDDGESFAALASELSTDPGSKDSGGDLGWFAQGVMLPEFETAAYALEIGDVSQPVQTQFGYHVIQLLGRQVLPLTDSELATVKNNTWTEWLTNAKAAENVQTFDIWMEVVPTEPSVTPFVGGS